jgi:RNA polymerase sigma factor (sigma-70 family)
MVAANAGFEDLYAAEAQAVFSAVYLLSRDRDLAEEATQEAFARALERWTRLGDEPWVAGWVMTTAMNIARRAMRRRAAPWPDTDSQHDPDDALVLCRAIGALPHRQQEAVVLSYLLDLPTVQVARVMRLREGTVRTHLARALASLRSELKGDFDVER